MEKKASKLKIATYIVVSLILLQLITAYAFGLLLPGSNINELDRLDSMKLFNISNIKYTRNAFSTDVDADLSLNFQKINRLYGLNLSKDERLKNPAKLHMHMSHGLFTGLLHGYFVPTLAYGDVKITYPEYLQQDLKKIFGKNEPIQITKLVYVTNAVKYNFRIGDINYSDPANQFAAILKDVKFSSKCGAGCRKLETTIDMPVVKFSSNAVVFEVNNLKGHYKQKYILRKYIPIEDDSYSVDSITFKAQGESPFVMAIKNLAFKLSTSEKKNFINLDETLKIENVKIQENSYDDLKLDMAYNHLSEPALDDMIVIYKSILDEASKSNQDIGASLVMQLVRFKPQFAYLMENKPEILINDASVKLTKDTAKIVGKFTTNNFKIEDLDNFKSFLDKIVLDIQLSIPKTLLDSDPNYAQAKEYFKVDGDKAKTHFMFKDGQGYINDKAFAGFDSNSIYNGYVAALGANYN